MSIIKNVFIRQALLLPVSLQELQDRGMIEQTSGRDGNQFSVKNVQNSKGFIFTQRLNYTLNGCTPERGTKSQLKIDLLKSLIGHKSSTTADVISKPEIVGDVISKPKIVGDALLDRLNDRSEPDASRFDPLDAPLARFSDIKADKDHLASRSLQISELKVRGKSVGYACQYPKNDALPGFYKFVAEQKLNGIHVISSDTDKEKHKLTRYFEPENGTSGPVKLPEGMKLKNMTVTSTFAGEEMAGTLLNKFYDLTIKTDSCKHTVRVMHTTNWIDHQAVGLVEIDKLVALRQAMDPSGEKILTHCNAGVGRTGTMIAAQSMVVNKGDILTTVLDIRACRNNMMVQTVPQVQALVDWAKSKEGEEDIFGTLGQFSPPPSAPIDPNGRAPLNHNTDSVTAPQRRLDSEAKKAKDQDAVKLSLNRNTDSSTGEDVYVDLGSLSAQRQLTPPIATKRPQAAPRLKLNLKAVEPQGKGKGKGKGGEKPTLAKKPILNAALYLASSSTSSAPDEPIYQNRAMFDTAKL